MSPWESCSPWYRRESVSPIRRDAQDTGGYREVSVRRDGLSANRPIPTWILPHLPLLGKLRSSALVLSWRGNVCRRFVYAHVVDCCQSGMLLFRLDSSFGFGQATDDEDCCPANSGKEVMTRAGCSQETIRR
jgi:hypothetical protein